MIKKSVFVTDNENEKRLNLALTDCVLNATVAVLFRVNEIPLYLDRVCIINKLKSWLVLVCMQVKVKLADVIVCQ